MNVGLRAIVRESGRRTVHLTAGIVTSSHNAVRASFRKAHLPAAMPFFASLTIPQKLLQADHCHHRRRIPSLDLRRFK